MDLCTTGLRRAILFLIFGLLLPVGATSAGSATWSITGSGDWNVADNWTPATIPNGPNDIATINGSFVHSISLSAATEVDRIVFGSTATVSYTITTPPAAAQDQGRERRAQGAGHLPLLAGRMLELPWQ